MSCINTKQYFLVKGAYCFYTLQNNIYAFYVIKNANSSYQREDAILLGDKNEIFAKIFKTKDISKIRVKPLKNPYALKIKNFDETINIKEILLDKLELNLLESTEIIKQKTEFVDLGEALCVKYGSALQASKVETNVTNENNDFAELCERVEAKYGITNF